MCYFSICIYFKIIIQGEQYTRSRILRNYTTVSAVGVHACGEKIIIAKLKIDNLHEKSDVTQNVY